MGSNDFFCKYLELIGTITTKNWMTCFKLQGTGTGPWHECGRPWQTRDLLWEEGQEENCEDEGGQGGGQVGQGLLQGLISDLWTKETLEEEGIHDHKNIQVTAIASANISHTALSLANSFQFVTCQIVFENKLSKHFDRFASSLCNMCANQWNWPKWKDWIDHLGKNSIEKVLTAGRQ